MEDVGETANMRRRIKVCRRTVFLELFFWRVTSGPLSLRWVVDGYTNNPSTKIFGLASLVLFLPY